MDQPVRPPAVPVLSALEQVDLPAPVDAQDAGIFLPAAIRSCINGRLGTMENRMASLLYKQAVELEMCERILSDSLELDEAYLRRKRAESIGSVKRTNGQLRFEQVARHAEDD